MRIFAVLALFVAISFVHANEHLPAIMEASVMIATEDSSGSGVAFKNKDAAFVWTDAHVVQSCQTVKTVICPKDGRPKVVVSYSDVWLVKAIVCEGRKVGEDKRLAKIIRYCGKEDIALLAVYQKGWLKNGAKFPRPKAVPEQGMSIYHVGSPIGPSGIGTIMTGNVSFVGRLRKAGKHSDTDGYVYDQATVAATYGSSGGGVFCTKTSHCLGLLTEFLQSSSVSPSLLCFTPSRRLWEFSERNRCLWAMNSEVAVPAQHEVLTDDELDVPADFGVPAKPAGLKLRIFPR